MRNTLTVVILLTCLKAGDGFLTQKPQDSVAVIGKPAYLNCSTSEPSKRIQWYHYAVGEAQREAIYRCDNFTEYWYPCYRNGRYVVERNLSSGAYNLVIPTVVSSDAGRFLCEVDGDEGLANLTALVESSPACVASEICKPYIKPYKDAIICIFLIILPAAVVGTILTLYYYYRRIYRPNKLKHKGLKEKADNPVDSSQENKKEDQTEEMANTRTSTEESKKLMSEKKDHTTKIKDSKDLNETQAIRIRDLENELKRKRNEVETYEDRNKSQLGEINKLQEQNKTSNIEIRQLKAMVKDLENRLYPKASIDYSEKPSLVDTIITDTEAKERRKPISGMTILGQELFVSHENSAVVKVYDSATFQFTRDWVIDRLSDPMDIASCKVTNCLYVIHREGNDLKSRIVKFEQKGPFIKQWGTDGDRGRLSTYESNVIVCLHEDQVIHEYTKEGVLIQTVRLYPDSGFNHPWHAIKVASSHFAVCHGDAKDESNRVCIVDAEGNIIKELREWESKVKDGKLNVPICLLEDSERSILVADRDSQRIRLLNCFLKLHRNLLSKEKGLDGYPVRICLDETKGRLFVAANTLRSSKKEWRDGRVLIFNVK